MEKRAPNTGDGQPPHPPPLDSTPWPTTATPEPRPPRFNSFDSSSAIPEQGSTLTIYPPRRSNATKTSDGHRANAFLDEGSVRSCPFQFKRELCSSRIKDYIDEWQATEGVYLRRRASRSHSRRQRMSPSRTGPLTLRMMERVGSSKNSTRTCEYRYRQIRKRERRNRAAFILYARYQVAVSRAVGAATSYI